VFKGKPTSLLGLVVSGKEKVFITLTTERPHGRAEGKDSTRREGLEQVIIL
jgi:hypothetical protein